MKPTLAIIIATKNRPDALDNALKSVSNQTIRPDKVVVVSDCSENIFEKTSLVISKHSENINVELFRNKRTSNLSGAMNTALGFLSEFFIPEQTICAILDDDDDWTIDHLEKSLSVFKDGNFDVVISGLIRHESLDDPGIPLSIPTTLTTHDFLIGNPHVQGSNLLIRLSSFLECGGFDENLCSTTDRDLCIRLLNSGFNFGITNHHTVHHWALPGKNRLSDPGSSQKKIGLISFYSKYHNIMTEKEKALFTQRAKQIFKIELNENSCQKITNPCQNDNEITGTDKLNPSGYTPLLIGFTASSTILACRLLDELECFLKNFDKDHCIVLCDNCPSLKSDEIYKKYPSLNLKIFSKEKIQSDIDCGSFGDCFNEKNSKNGISAGRTILHHYLYLKSREVPGCSIWILDDDIRLDFFDESGMPIVLTMSDFQSLISKLKHENASIGVGKITGDAPLPIHSTLRTQLLDIVYELRSRLSDTRIENNSMEQIYAIGCDYYYDYSEKHFNHLETPVNHTLINLTDSELIQSIIDTIHGKSITRPLVRTEDFSNGLNSSSGIPVIPRGGNTIVLNAEVLRDFPNISPQFNGLNARRGDTLWCLLNSHVGAHKVVPSILPVRQDRIPVNKIQKLDILASDFVGSSLVKALTDYYNNEILIHGKIPRRTNLFFNEADLKKIICFFEQNIELRSRNLKMNAYRIRGLIRECRNLLFYQMFSDLDSTKDALKILDELESVYSLDNIESVIFSMKTSVSDVETFVLNLYHNTESYKQTLPEYFGQKNIDYAESVFRMMLKDEHIDDSELIIIGKGKEGIIAKAGSFVYKYFFFGSAGFEDGNLEIIKKMVGKEFNHVCKLDKIVCFKGHFILVMEYVYGEKYKGGYLDEIRNMLLELRNRELVFTNICPGNLIVNSGNVKLIDLGRSWIPFSEIEFHKMCIRAYLTYRWHFRDDLKELMNKAMTDESIPELAGFNLFLKSMEKTSKKEMLDPSVIKLCNNYKHIFDFGCGRGSIAEVLAKNGKNVTGYDIDEAIIKKNKRLNQIADYIWRDELELLKKSEQHFECVICSLVLCCVDDLEAESVINDVRMLTSNSGIAVVAICNPSSSFVEHTLLHKKLTLPGDVDISSHFVYHKKTHETGNVKTEYHRPLSWYENLFQQYGFLIDCVQEIESLDLENLTPSNEFMLFRLIPIVKEIEIAER
ncbi:hypothetical protein MmiEs2_14870 [Methanimicrococcus stummii]|uniref:Glycosyltransferase 2-like domain-containing protein n=1 Tax=Methanimicrococcus stummii TaxID=3028294 RepID=A0AA96V9J7_9EURY|nr:glycosyltransferase [Methanimicrococcus sp. Es2]WNY29262.1 hypothetical protein MmiEs2_14870 [Methanimicrococcus sp. Es2]